MKNPDALDYATEDMNENDRYLAHKVAEKYMEYGEYITVEFDTETESATVIPN
jgi:hypothetical protein